MGLPGFPRPCLGLGRVLLRRAWPAQAQLRSAGRSGSACRGTSQTSVWLWWPWLPGVLEVLPQPGGQRLAHLVQQLGKLDVVVPVIVLQEGAGL